MLNASYWLINFFLKNVFFGDIIAKFGYIRWLYSAMPLLKCGRNLSNFWRAMG